MKNSKIILHLSLIKNIGPASVLKIIHVLYKDFCKNHQHPQISRPDFNLESLYRYKTKNLTNKFEISERIAQLIVNGLAEKKALDQELKLIEKYNINFSCFLDSSYPESLKQIYHPPLVLYSKGKPIDDKSKKIAIVGSRKAGFYAKNCIEKLVPSLVQHNYEIVSGGAAGVDSFAHKETLKSGGKTIAVFGSGLTQPYPTENKELFRQIVKNSGTLVSPFPLQTTPNKGNFPARNRIISGLSQGCLVVQAAKKSGALITSQFALDQGKQVFAIPGEIENELSAGCHKLIQQGAKLVTNVDDIFEEFYEQAQPVAQVKPVTQAQPTQNPILKNLKKPCSIDEISNKTKIPLSELQNRLFALQLEGKVKQNFAGLWEEAG